MNLTISKKEVMTNAWFRQRTIGGSFRNNLYRAWTIQKEKPAYRIQKAVAELEKTEASKAMKRAWAMFRSGVNQTEYKLTFTECLKEAWRIEKKNTAYFKQQEAIAAEEIRQLAIQAERQEKMKGKVFDPYAGLGDFIAEDYANPYHENGKRKYFGD